MPGNRKERGLAENWKKIEAKSGFLGAQCDHFERGGKLVHPVTPVHAPGEFRFVQLNSP
jgi:hypothetical protein